MPPAVHIGTSGWHYKHWKGNFYPAQIDTAKMLQTYVQHFNSVEINNSFYRLPSEEAVKSWVKQTPPQFIFAVKASRYITHNKKLKNPKETFARFMDVAKGFGKKLGPILFQLPPSWKVNPERLGDFLDALPKKRRYVFELRNASWHTPAVYEILRQYNAAFCIFELNGFLSGVQLTADFVYVRLHGPGKAYQGDYSPLALHSWSEKIHGWVEQGHEVFFYFDNDQAGFAAKNAATLSELVERIER